MAEAMSPKAQYDARRAEYRRTHPKVEQPAHNPRKAARKAQRKARAITRISCRG